MTKYDNPAAAVKAFRGYTRRVKDIEEAHARDSDRHRARRENQGRSKLIDIAWREIRDMKRAGVKGLPSESEFRGDEEKAYNLSKKILLSKNGVLDRTYQNAVDDLHDNLDDILGKVSDKKLEGMLSNEKDAKLIAEAADKGYADWAKFYSAYHAANELLEKAKRGDLEKKEKDALLAPVAQEAARVNRERFKGIKSRSKQDAAEAIAIEVVMDYAGKRGYVEGAKKLREEAEDALRNYENANGKDLRGYMASAFKRLTDDVPKKVSERALQMVDEAL